MRNFFIRSFDVLIAVIAVLLILFVLYGTYAIATAPSDLASLDIAAISNLGPFASLILLIGGGIVPALIWLVGGLIYTIIVVGFLYIGTGIYINTKRTADAVETMLNR